jgi:drug/metabolite transporter (DMT)-like permease
MIAFASNSLLCRAALKETKIDAASFTFIRIFSGAVALWLVLTIQRLLRVDRTASPLVESLSDSLRRYGNWISAFALFVYAAGFSFAYTTLPAGTGALLLFGAVQATMILWGLQKGERLSSIQVAGFIIAVTGLIVLVLPGVSAPPLIGAILMLGGGVAWGVYSLRGKGEQNPATATTGNFVRAVPFATALSIIFIMRTRLNLAGVTFGIISGAITSGFGCDLVQRANASQSSQCGYRATQRSGPGCYRRNTVAWRTDHDALRASFICRVRRNRARGINSLSNRSNCFP